MTAYLWWVRCSKKWKQTTDKEDTNQFFVDIQRIVLFDVIEFYQSSATKPRLYED